METRRVAGMMNRYYDSLYWPCAGFQNPNIVFGVIKRSYTIRIEQWMKIKHPELDPIDSDQLLQAGLDSVFKNMNLNAIDDKYRQVFMVQFLNEFYMNEIGQETTDLFRQNLNRIIMNHGRYITSLYEMAEKKYFVEYSYKTVDTKHKTDSENTQDETGSVTDSRTTSGENSRKVDEDDSRMANREHSKEGQQIDHSIDKDKSEKHAGQKSTVKDDGTTTRDNEKHEGKSNSGWDKKDYEDKGIDKTIGHSNSKSDSTGHSAGDNYEKYGSKGGQSGWDVSKDHDEGTNYNYTNHERHLTDTTHDENEGWDHAHTHSDVEGTNTMSDTPQNQLDSLIYETYMTQADRKKGFQDDTTESSFHHKDDRTVDYTGFEDTDTNAGHDNTIDRNSSFNHENKSSGNKEGKNNAWNTGHSEVNTNATNDKSTFLGHDESASHEHQEKTNASVNEVEHAVNEQEGSRTENENQKAESSHEGTINNNESGNIKDEESGTRHADEIGKESSKSDGNSASTKEINARGNVRGTNNVIDEAYTINRDSIFMTNDITDRIWELFDSCFMQVL